MGPLSRETKHATTMKRDQQLADETRIREALWGGAGGQSANTAPITVGETRDESVSSPRAACYVAACDAIEEILREVVRCRDDSVRDIANDAFISHGLPLRAEWTDDDLAPIRVTKAT